MGVGEKVLLPEYGGTKINFDDKVLFTGLCAGSELNASCKDERFIICYV